MVILYRIWPYVYNVHTELNLPMSSGPLVIFTTPKAKYTCAPPPQALGNSGIFCLTSLKGKVVSVLFLTDHNAMKAYWGSGGIAQLIL
jgi:hypothetical protein